MRSRMIVAVVALCVASSAFGDEKGAARRAFLGKNPGTRLYRTRHRITTIYGKAFGSGNSAVDSAERFRKSRASMLGLAARDLRAGNRFNQRLTQPVMYDAKSDSYKYTLVYYRQFFGDIPVYRCELRLLVGNQGGFPLVWGRAHVRELGAFSVDPNRRTLDRDVLEALATAEMPWLTNYSAPRRVVWAGIDDQVDQARLAFELVGDNYADESGEAQKWLFVMDALTGEIVCLEDQIQKGTDDITGNTSGNASEKFKSHECDAGVKDLTGLPYALVEVVGTPESAYADVNGDFVIDHSGTDPVTVRSHISGKWFKVFDAAGSHDTIPIAVTPPGPVNFEHNPDDEGVYPEFISAQVNAYIQANLARDTALAANPMYPTISTQESFPINVNAGSCFGRYD